MKKEAFRKLLRALRWPAKRVNVVSTLKRITTQKAQLEDALKRLNFLAKSNAISPIEYGRMSDNLAKHFENITKVSDRLMKYRVLGDADRKALTDTGKGLLLTSLFTGAGGLAVKDLYDKTKKQMEYINPTEAIEIERSIPELQQKLDDRRQYGSWL